VEGRAGTGGENGRGRAIKRLLRGISWGGIGVKLRRGSEVTRSLLCLTSKFLRVGRVAFCQDGGEWDGPGSALGAKKQMRGRSRSCGEGLVRRGKGKPGKFFQAVAHRGTSFVIATKTSRKDTKLKGAKGRREEKKVLKRY